MSNLILSKKGEVKRSKIFWIIFCILFVVYFLANPSEPFGTAQELLYLNVLVRITPYVFLTINLIGCIKQKKSYIKIYDNYIEGVAVENQFKSVQFRFSKGEYTVTRNKTTIYIASVHQKISLNLSNEDAMQIYEILQHHKM